MSLNVPPTTTLQLTKQRGDVQSTVSKRHPLHGLLEPGSSVRFEPELHDRRDGTTIGFEITFGTGVDPSDPLSRRMKYIAANDQHLLVWPIDLARALGLPKHAVEHDTDVRLLSGNDTDRFRVRFDPSIELQHLGDDGFDLDVDDGVSKRLTASVRENNDDGTQGVPEKYRLRFPVRYNDQFGLSEGEQIGVSVGEYENELAIVLSFNGEAELTRTLQHERTQTPTSAGNISTTELFSLNIPKILVHFALEGELDVELHPTESRIVIFSSNPSHR